MRQQLKMRCTEVLVGAGVLRAPRQHAHVNVDKTMKPSAVQLTTTLQPSVDMGPAAAQQTIATRPHRLQEPWTDGHRRRARGSHLSKFLTCPSYMRGWYVCILYGSPCALLLVPWLAA